MSRKIPAQDASLPPPTCTWCGLVPAKLKAEKEYLGKKLAKYLSYCDGCEARAKSVPKQPKVPQTPPTAERRPDGTRVRTEAQREARKRQKQRAKERRRAANADARLGLAEERQRLDFRGVSIRKMLREM